MIHYLRELCRSTQYFQSDNKKYNYATFTHIVSQVIHQSLRYRLLARIEYIEIWKFGSITRST